MRKSLIFIGVLSATVLANPIDSKMEKMRLWCEHNWQKCKEFKLSELKIREKYIHKEKECVENADTHKTMSMCIMDVREQMRREVYDLRKNLLNSSGSRH